MSTFPIRQSFASALACAVAVFATNMMFAHAANAAAPEAAAILKRNTETSRVRATRRPKSEQDQAIIGGWPLYRTPRGQEAFNDAMATLSATAGPAPDASQFKNCASLHCPLRLPKIGANGWLPAGRLWLSPRDYVVIVRSPRHRISRRRTRRTMKIFVYHEFHNGTRNVDLFDTVSAHSRSVFTPFYMSKPHRDPAGRRFVFLVQTAPYDVISRHASNLKNLGPGMEVANNYGDRLSDIQLKAGFIVADMVLAAAPQLKVVNHRGTEGKAMLRAYQRRKAALRRNGDRPTVTLPFITASKDQLVSASAPLAALVAWAPGAKPNRLAPEPVARPVAVADALPRQRAAAPKPQPKPVVAAPTPKLVAAPASVPRLVAPPQLAAAPAPLTPAQARWQMISAPVSIRSPANPTRQVGRPVPRAPSAPATASANSGLTIDDLANMIRGK